MDQMIELMRLLNLKLTSGMDENEEDYNLGYCEGINDLIYNMEQFRDLGR